MPAMANCPYCGKLTDPNLGNCVHCGGYLQRGAGAAPLRKAPASASQTCPSCGALVQPGDIICVACGTSILTGQRIIEGKKVAAPRFAVNWRLIIGLTVAAAVILAIALGIYYYTRDPIKEAARLTRAGQLSQAAQILNQAVQQNPQNARAQFEFGKILWRQNQKEAAASAFEQAARLDPSNVEAYLYGALALATQNRPETRSREIVLLSELVRIEPENEQARYLLAMARGADGDFAGQLRDLESAPATPDNEAVIAQARGLAHALLGELDDAQRELAIALQTGGDDPDLHATVGLVASLQGNSELAATELEKAAAAGTNIESIVLTQLGLQQVAAGEFESARGTLQRAIARDPSNEQAKFFAAVCQFATGEENEAVREFEALYRGTGPLADDAAIQAAQIYLARGDTDRAKDTADLASNLGNASAVLYTLKGRIQMAQSQDAAAQDLFKQAVQADPKYAPARLEYGLWYIKRGVLAEGVRELEQYLSLVDNDAPDARTAEIRALVDQLRKAGNLANAAHTETEPRRVRAEVETTS